MRLSHFLPRFAGTALAAMAATVISAQPAHAQLGIGGGVNFNQADDIDVSDVEGTFDDATGYHVGLFLSLGEGTLQFRPGVFYHRLGTFDFPGDEDDLELSAIEVPLDVKLNVLPLGMVEGYILGSPVVTFPQSSGPEGATTDAALSADIGAGVAFNLPGSGMSIMPEVRYSFGVADYLEDSFDVGGVTVSPSEDARHVEKVVIRLNILF